MQPTLLPSATLAEYYRFAVLLTGSARAAEAVLADVLAQAQGQMEQLRNETSRRAWLATRLRERCLEEKVETPPAPGLVRGAGEGEGNPEVLKIEAFLLAQRWQALPEPERTALALFHLDLFSTEEIAQILQMKTEELADTIGRARSLLRDSLKAMREEGSPTP